MVYADYDFYNNVYFGTLIPYEDFQRLAVRASAFIDYCTLGRAQKCADMEAVKLACCAVAEDYRAAEIAQRLVNKSLTSGLKSDESGELQSQSVGSWSKSYRSGGSSAVDAMNSATASKSSMLESVKMYLANTGLLQAKGYCT